MLGDSYRLLSPDQLIYIVSKKFLVLIVKKPHSTFWMAFVIISVADCVGDFSSRMAERNILSAEVVGLVTKEQCLMFFEGLNMAVSTWASCPC